MNVYIWDKTDWKDPRENFLKMMSWAQDNCKSFVSVDIVDVSDLSNHDYVGDFKFTDERDAILFSLKWS